jgi:3-hydroxyisobutyrate dehydrogenase-like beta-hydroxyacid dehydrogenase
MAAIGFIGLGAMGTPMARRLMQAGHQLTVYARRPRVAQAFVDNAGAPAAHACAVGWNAGSNGARVARSPAECASGAECLITNVTTTGDVEDVLLGTGAHAGRAVIDGASRGAIVCDMSTISADITRRIANALEERGIEMLDCPVSGGTQGAEAGTLTILVGGKPEVLERARPILERIGSAIFHMGDHGAGQVTKACNQIVQVVTIQGIAEAMLFARHNGVDCAREVDALMSGFAGSKMLGLMGPKMARRDFAAGIEARLHHKDFSLIMDAVADERLPMPATAVVHQQLSRLMERGWGTMDTSNLLRVLEADGVSGKSGKVEEVEK